MTGARWAALAAIAAIAVGAAGCGGEDERTEVERIAVVTPGSRADADWTGTTVAAVRRVAKRARATVEVIDGSAGDVAAAIERAAQRAQLIVVPYDGDRATAVRLAAEHEVPTLVWGDPGALREGTVGDVEVDWEGGAYAAGFLSSHASFFEGVGAVVCADGSSDELAQRYAIASAFFAGARADNPRVKIAYAPAGGDGKATEAEALRATLKTTRAGAQMVLGACGLAAHGVFIGTVRAGGETMFVGLVGEPPITEENENNIMTSVLVDPAPALERAVRDVESDRFGTRAYPLDFANGGVALLATGRTPTDAHEAGVEAGEQLAEDGDVALPGAADEAELRAYMAGE